MIEQMRKRHDGHILIFTLAVLAVLFILTTAALNLIRFDQHFANQSYRVKQARQIAEAGIDVAIRRLNDNSAYTGETGLAIGCGEVNITVSGIGSSRTIEASGYCPSEANPIAKRRIIVDADISSSEAEFFYGIQVDAGGLQMDNGSGVVGNVYSNGNIVGGNGAYITGDAIVAGGLTADPTLEWTAVDDNGFFATVTGNRDIAQSFIAPASDKLNKLAVYLGKVGNPTASLSVRLVGNDSDNTPLASDLASGTIAASTVGNNPSWINVTFPTPATLTAGTKYWLILDSSSNSGSNYWDWGQDSSDGYSNNTGLYTSNWSTGGASWTDVGGDLGFKVWVGGVATKIEGMIIGSSTSGNGYANSFVNTTIHGSACPNVYCVIDNPPSESLPFSDGLIQDWKDDAAAGGTQVGDYILTNGATGSLGPRKIQGNLNLDNGAILTITGTVYVTGNINISNNCQVILDNGYAEGSGIIVTDGAVTISNNCSFSGAQSGSYVLLLTTLDNKAGVGMNISNNSQGVIYYAGKTRIQFDNNATAKEATAWGINLSNNAVISYESGLANIFFTGGPGGGWTVKRSTWREVRTF